MKKLDLEQKCAIDELYNVAFAREMVGFVKMQTSDYVLNPRAIDCWNAKARVTIINILSEKRDALIQELGLEKGPFTVG